MPVYDYLCSACDHRADILHGINDPGPNFCPSCGAEGTMRKQFAAPAVHFKGSGWAKKDRGSSAMTRAGARSKPSDGDSSATSDHARDGASERTRDEASDRARDGASERTRDAAGEGPRDAVRGGTKDGSSSPETPPAASTSSGNPNTTE
jgi:putative FmdB family regulatory protein